MKITPKPTWIQRTQAHRPTNAPRLDAPLLGARLKTGEERVTTQLVALKIPEKIAAEHGAPLKAAMRDAGKLATLPVEPWRARQLERALEQLYKILGKSLSALPEAERADYAKASLKAYVKMAESCGANDQLMPSLYAATGLVDSGNRLREKERVRGVPSVEAATQAVTDLRTSLSGRTGVGSALNVFANLVEQVERSEAKLTQGKREKLYGDVAKFLDSTMPLTGFDQATAAKFSAILEKNGADLAAAKKEALAEGAPRLQEVLAQHRAMPNHPAMDKALEKILLANPTGPEALYTSVETFRQAAINFYQGRPDNEAMMTATAKFVDRLAQDPAARPALDLLSQILPNAVYQANVLAHLEEAANKKDLGDLGAGLLRTQLQIYGRWENVDAELDSLNALEPGAALQVAIAAANLVPSVNPVNDTLRALITAAVGARPEDPAKSLGDFGTRFVQLVGQLYLNQNTPEIAAKIAAKTQGNAVDGNFVAYLGNALRQMQNDFPNTDLSSLLEPIGERPGLMQLADPSIRYRNEPTNILSQLTPYMRYQDDHAARFVVALAARVGQMDGDPWVPLSRMQSDISTAYGNPAALHMAARGQSAIAVRAQQNPTVQQFLEAHPELPLEMALTAGVHCTPEQLTWFISKITETKARDVVRSLRDFLFACVTVGRMDLIDTARTSPSNAKAIQAAITHIGREYRANRAYEIQWDALKNALDAGQDPMGDNAKMKLDAGIQGIDLAELAGPKPDPAGMEMIARCAVALSNCFEYYNQQVRQPSGSDSTLNHERCIQPLKDVVADIAHGTWPKVKYENEVGKRLLSILTPAQQKIWREEMITSPGAIAVEIDDDSRKMLALMRGIQKAIPKELPNLELTAKSYDALRKQQDALLQQLHDVKKGSKAHKTLGKQMAEVSRPLAIIELMRGLKSAFAGGPEPNPQQTMSSLRGTLESAQSALSGMNAGGSARAVAEVLFLAQSMPAAAARKGHYAIDEDTLDALIQSHTRTSGSCLNHVDGFRKWGLSGAAADANIRMLRVYDSEKFGYRAFLKLFPVQFDNYNGPALWIDSPMAEGPVQNEDLQMLYENAIKKAKAMGIPVIGPDGNLTAQGTKMGHEVRNSHVTFHVAEGNTGSQHSDTLFGGRGDIAANIGANGFYDVSKNAQIVMP